MTDANKAKSFQGGIDIPLNDIGHAQAEDLANYFSKIPLDVIYSSPMQRACETAKKISEVKHISINLIREFRELSFGDWDGIEYSEIEKKWPEEMKKFLIHPSEFYPHNAPTFEDRQKEAWNAFQNIYRHEGSGKQIAIVSHGGISRLLIGAILGMSIDKMWCISLDNCSVTTFYEWGGRFILGGFNDTHFLKKPIDLKGEII